MVDITHKLPDDLTGTLSIKILLGICWHYRTLAFVMMPYGTKEPIPHWLRVAYWCNETVDYVDISLPYMLYEGEVSTCEYTFTSLMLMNTAQL